MARNKHPEETVEKILDVASRLFLEIYLGRKKVG